MRALARSVLFGGCVLGVCAACGPDPEGSSVFDSGGEAQGPDATPVPRADAGPEPFEGSVYAHSATDLYEIDPDTLDITHVGPFTYPGLGETDVITDIALDRQANMTGISYDKVFAIDRTTAVCTFLADLPSQLVGLSFVPAEEIDPTGAEQLVGTGTDGSIYRIDPATGGATYIGSFGGSLYSSGDIVSVRGFGTVATVKDGLEVGDDHLARVDLAGGGAATIIGSTGFNDIWGLGFWRGQVFGFTNDYEFILIDPATGAASLVERTDPYWWGAGVTTEAPVIP